MKPKYIYKDQFFAALKEIRPSLTREEFEQMWAGFILRRELWRRRN